MTRLTMLQNGHVHITGPTIVNKAEDTEN